MRVTERFRKANLLLSTGLIFLVILACGGLKDLGKKDKTADANKLVVSAEEDLAEVDRIIEENDDTTSELAKAENGGDVDGVRSILDRAMAGLDNGLERGRSAAKKIEDASKMDIEPVFKDYLVIKADAFKKQVEAFESLREAARIEREHFGAGGDEEDEAKSQFRSKHGEYKRKIEEARELHRKADKLARDNPNKIKT